MANSGPTQPVVIGTFILRCAALKVYDFQLIGLKVWLGDRSAHALPKL